MTFDRALPLWEEFSLRMPISLAGMQAKIERGLHVFASCLCHYV
jgi:hypothetical protein